MLQNCAYGGPRPKYTRVAHNHHTFFSLARLCPGEDCAKDHLPWGRAASGRWATAEEVAYPTDLAVAIARCFRAAVDVTPPLKPDIAAVRAVAGTQPKASKLPPLVSEHEHVIVMRGPASALVDLPLQPMQRLCKVWTPPSGVVPQVPVPAGAQYCCGPHLCRLSWGLVLKWIPGPVIK